MKILYIGNNLNSSNPTTLVQLSEVLKGEGFNVVVYSNKKNKLLRLFDMCFGMLKYRKVDYLLIDTYSTANFYVALILSQIARVFSIKYIPILHGGNLPDRIEKKSWMSHLIFKNSYVNVSPSRYLHEVFNQWGYKTISIPNLIDIQNYKFKKRDSIHPKLLWVRAFDEIYNPEMAVEVLYELKKTHGDAVLCMVGPDKDGSLNKVVELAKEKNVLEAIEFTGILSKKDWICKSEEYDIFINTTNFDNMPVSVIEAMALGLPIISTNVGGMPYLIKHKLNGFLVEKNDVLQMTSIISDLIENPSEILKITKQARIDVAKFDEHIVKQQWKDILN